jgi:hypothetical protein
MFHEKVLGILDGTVTVVEDLVVLLFELDTLDELVHRHGILIVGIEVVDRDVVVEDVVDGVVVEGVVNLVEDRGSRGQAVRRYTVHLLMEFLDTGDQGRGIHVGKDGCWFRCRRFASLLVFP